MATSRRWLAQLRIEVKPDIYPVDFDLESHYTRHQDLMLCEQMLQRILVVTERTRYLRVRFLFQIEKENKVWTLD